MRRLALLLSSLLAMLPLAARAQGQATGPALSVQEVERIVKEYLLREPEILFEALQELQRRRDAAEAQRQRAVLVERRGELHGLPEDPVLGDPAGDVTLVAFMDYRCGYCRRAFQTVEELVEGDGNIRFVLKEFPILGPQSELASRFAIAVHQIHGDDAYKDVHDALMTFQGDITPEALGRLAEALALDPEPVLARMDAPEVTAIIAQNRALANRLGITGTPTFVLGGRMVRGFVPLEAMEALVEQARNEG